MPEGLKYIVGITDQRLSSGTRPYQPGPIQLSREGR